MTPRPKNMTLRDRRSKTAPEHTVAAGVARGLIRLAVKKGASEAALLDRSGIDPHTLQDQDTRIPFPQYVALMRAGQELSGDPALALHFAEEIDFSEISILGLLTQACETMQDAFIQLNRYNRLVAEHDTVGGANRFEHQPAGPGLLWLVDNRVDPNAFIEATEGAFARFVHGPRLFEPTPFCRAVHVTHSAPAYAAEYDRIFRVPVTFESDKNALLIDETWPQRRIALSQRYVFGVLSEKARGLMAELETTKSVSGRVEHALMRRLHTGDLGVETVAKGMGLSRQTLYRQLRAEGVTYEGLLDALRHRMAVNYLDGRKVSVGETAYLVGFSDPSAFSRAFKRWTGVSPRLRQG